MKTHTEARHPLILTWAIKFAIVLCLLWLVAPILFSIASAQQLTAAGPVTVVPPGTSGTIQINFVNGTGTPAPAVAGLQFTVTGTADTGPLSAVAGTAATQAGKQISCATLASKALTCIIWGLNVTAIGNGDVADITVPILQTATLSTDTIGLSGAIGASVTGTAVTVSAFAGSIAVFNPCDFNHDGAIDIVDVTQVVAQANGSTACTTGDLTKDLKCNVLDVYREVIAALPLTSGVAGAGVCRTGQ